MLYSVGSVSHGTFLGPKLSHLPSWNQPYTFTKFNLNVDFYTYSYIHKLTPFSLEGRQKLLKATCYDRYILLSPRPHLCI